MCVFLNWETEKETETETDSNIRSSVVYRRPSSCNGTWSARGSQNSL